MTGAPLHKFILSLPLCFMAMHCSIDPAHADNLNQIPTCGGSTGQTSGSSTGMMDQAGQACVANGQPVQTFYGVATISSGTSTSLIAANVTMEASTTLPTAGHFGTLTIKNTGTTNPVTVCWGGGTCSATAGEVLAAGAQDTKNLSAYTAAPTVFSTSGTTIYIDN